MRLITDELAAYLRSRLQVGVAAFAGRIEVDIPPSESETTSRIQYGTVGYSNIGSPNAAVLPGAPTPGNTVVIAAYANNAGFAPPGFTELYAATMINFKFNDRHLYLGFRVVEVGDDASYSLGMEAGAWQGMWAIAEYEGTLSAVDTLSASGSTGGAGSDAAVSGANAETPGVLVSCAYAANSDTPTAVDITSAGDLTDDLLSGEPDSGTFGVADGVGTVPATAEAGWDWTPGFPGESADEPYRIGAAVLAFAPGVPTAISYQPKRIALNRNLRMGPDQAEVELANEDLALGWGPTSIFPTNSRWRIYQWLGDVANEVLVFTGIIDKIADGRDVLTTKLTGRSLAGAILVDQTFSTTAPQGADEDGAVRTEDNGVYLAVEVDYVVADRLERAGWPAADIDVEATSFVLDEFLVADGASEWDTLARLAELVGYTLWDDEDGVIHFRRIGEQASADAVLTPDYEYEVGAA